MLLYQTLDITIPGKYKTILAKTINFKYQLQHK